MSVKLSRKRSWFVPARTLVVLGGVVLVAAVAIGVALASTTAKKFDATIVQNPNGTFTLTLTNHISSNPSFGSANIEIPDGFTTPTNLQQTVAGGTKQWLAPFVNTGVTPNRIELRSPNARNQLAPGESLTLTFTATAPCSADPYEWPTYVKQSNNFLGTGNDFDGPVPSVSVTGALAEFDVSEVDDPQLVDRAIDVDVEALDDCGNRVDFDGSATLSGLDGVAGTTLVFEDGLASASVTPLQSQVDATLTVANAQASGESNEFDVVDAICGPGLCSENDGKGTSVTTTVPGGAMLLIRFSDFEGTSLCGSTPIIGSRITLDPIDYTEPTQVTFIWANALPPGVGVANYTICLDDGKPGSPKVLPKCANKDPVPTCELHRSRTGVADFRAVVLLAPFDPNFDFG